MSAKKIAILRGGDWDRYEESLKKGGDLVAYMFENLYPKYQPVDLHIDKSGAWHLRGQEVLPADLFHQVDMVWNMSDPKLSKILEHFEVPHISPESFAHALSESRDLLRSHIRDTKVCLPQSIALQVYQEDIDGDLENYSLQKAHEVFRKFPPPYLVKPVSSGSGMPTHSAKNFDELALAIFDAGKHQAGIIVEELIAGKDCAMHCVKNFRGEEVYRMMPRVHEEESKEVFSVQEKEILHSVAEELHSRFEDPDYIKFSMILSPKGKVFLKDINLHPDFIEDEHLESSSNDFGIKKQGILEHLLDSVLE